MNIKPLSLEGYLYTPLSNAGEILDNLSSISSWPSSDGTGGFDAPSLPEKQEQQKQQHGAFKLMSMNKHGHQAHPFDTIYTVDSSTSPFDPTASSANSSANFFPHRSDYPSGTDSFAEFDSCYDSDIYDPNDKDIQRSIDINDLLLNHSATSNKNNSSSNIESTKKNDMEFLTTTYITKSAAALNVSNISPLSIHPCLTMSRSSSFTSAVSYIDPSLLIQKNNNNNNDAISGSPTELTFSTSQARRFSKFSNGGLESEDNSYATMRAMFEESLRMGSPAFGSYSSEQFESLPSPFVTPFSVTTAVTTPTTAPLTSQDIYMADGSVIRFDGTSFRPVPTTTTTATMMNNGHTLSGLIGTDDSTVSSPPSMMISPYQQTTTAGSTDATPVYYDTMNWDSFSHAHHHRVPVLNDSFKTYNKSPYHKHLPHKSAATTTDSATFAAALLTPQSSGRRGSADSAFSAASGCSSRRSNRLVMGNHSRYGSATSFRDFDKRNHYNKRCSAASLSSSFSLPSPLTTSLLSTFTSESASLGSPSMSPPSSSSTTASTTSPTKYRKDKNGDFQCPYAGCNYRYNLKREFNRHRNVHVFAGKDKYRCMNCRSGLCRLDSVKRHMEAKGKAECLRKGFYEEFHESGQYSLIRKCKPTWYEAAAAARAASAASLKSKGKKV